jgi:hypothetical protein
MEHASVSTRGISRRAALADASSRSYWSPSTTISIDPSEAARAIPSSDGSTNSTRASLSAHAKASSSGPSVGAS